MPEYYDTITYLDLNGDGLSDACGRGALGVWCARDDGTGQLADDVLANPTFSDANLWALPQYYATIAYPDLNGDGMSDVCGRASEGLECALSNGSTFATTTLWSSDFPDYSASSTNWVLPRHYATIRYVDLNGDGNTDVCGRGQYGLICALSDGTQFGIAAQWSSTFSDDAGWDQPWYYSTLQFADVDGDGLPDVCGRGIAGISCELNSASSQTFESGGVWASAFSDGAGWAAPQYYSTIQFDDIDGDGRADVCGRGPQGVVCGLSTGSSFDTLKVWEPRFSGGAGANAPEQYSTIHIVGGMLCGRLETGITCSFSNLRDGFILPSTSLEESDANGWTHAEYYSTIGVGRDHEVFARGPLGLYAYNAGQGVLPNAPSALRVTGVTNRSVSLTWTDNSNDETRFDLYVGRSRSAPQLFSPGGGQAWQGPANTTSVTLTSLGGNPVAPDTTYCFSVAASIVSASEQFVSAHSNVVCAHTLNSALYAYIVDLGELDAAHHSVARAINNAGDVAGSDYLPNAPNTVWRYTAKTNQFSALQIAPADLGQSGWDVSGINDAGIIVGNSGFHQPGFMAKPGQPESLITGLYGSAAGINATGQVGCFEDFTDTQGNRFGNAFRFDTRDNSKHYVGRYVSPRTGYTFAGTIAVAGIGPGNELVGFAPTSEASRALTGGFVFDPGGWGMSEAMRVVEPYTEPASQQNLNDYAAANGWQLIYRAYATNGPQTVGWGVKDDHCRAFKHTAGSNEIIDLGTLASHPGADACPSYYAPSSINTQGEIIGNIAYGGAFYYSDALGRMVDLQDYVDPALQATIAQANAINDNGEIVGSMSILGDPKERAFKMKLPQ